MRNEALNKKEKNFVYLTLFYIAYMIFPLVADITNIPNYLPGILVVTISSLLYRRYLNGRPLRWLFIYIGVLFILGSIGHRVFINGLGHDVFYLWAIIVETAWILPSLMIMVIIINFNNYRVYKTVGMYSLCLLVVSFVYILPLIYSSAGYLRSSQFSDDMTMRPIGLPGYALMHAYTLVLLPLFWMVKNHRKNWQLISLALSLLFVYIINQTAVTTSLFIGIFILFFVMLMNPYDTKASTMRFGILAVILLVMYYTGVFLVIVDGLMPFFEGTAVEYKLIDMHDSMTLGHVTGDHLTVRMDVQKQSQEHFFANPIIGSGDAGGHSKIWDVLGTMGLAAGVPFLMTIWTSMKLWCRASVNKEMLYYVYAVFAAAFVFLYSKGLFSGEGWLFMTVIVPCIIMWQIYSKHN
ncbi:MAG: hypothetical protein SOV61_04830 [Lachnospiraceae bacterium]|nr:hypothetical protein [Lachnospiraceae bacterium]